MTIYRPADGIIRALTVREPWATLACMGIKTCEIRAWDWYREAFPFPMTLAMHASADDSHIPEDIDWVINKYDQAYFALNNLECKPCVPGKDFFYSQAIVGLVDVIGAMLIDPKWTKKEKRKRIVAAGFDVKYADWAEAPYSFFLANPRRFKTGIQCRGVVKIWKVDKRVQDHIEANEFNLLPTPQGEECGVMPTSPSGVVKCLGKPNYSEITRETQESIKNDLGS